jgi:perosamine synthetase
MMTHKIPIAKPNLGKEEIAAVKDVIESGILVAGPKTKEFEKKFSEYIGVKHAIAVTNGTIALDVTLKALKINPGDEVITSAFSFVSSGNCILFQNAKPVFADIDSKTYNIDPQDVVEKITSKTKAIIPVHTFGQPANMKALKEIAQDKKLALVEDSAQSHGAEYNKQKTGSIGDVGCFSFYATKNITTGEGGIITTNNQKLADKARLLINHGQDRKYHHEILGYNYRMTEICAAIGIVQLRKLDQFNAIRKENAQLLTQGIHKLHGLTTPHLEKDANHVFHQYVLKVEENYPIDRDELANFLIQRGIGIAIHYPLPIYKQPLYIRKGFGRSMCPNAEEACKRVLSLPVHPLVNKEDIKYMLEVLKS